MTFHQAIRSRIRVVRAQQRHNRYQATAAALCFRQASIRVVALYPHDALTNLDFS